MDSTTASTASASSAAPKRCIYKKKVPVGDDLFECLKDGALCDVDLLADDGKR